MRDARPLLIAMLLAAPAFDDSQALVTNGIAQPVPPHGTGGTGGTLGSGGTGSGGIGPGAGTGAIATGGSIVH